MQNFRDFLAEARSAAAMEDGPLTHLFHSSSLPHLAGPKGTDHAIGALSTLYQNIAKGKLPKELAVKVDGSPSVVISGPTAKHPGGTVATKSAFNVNPKINSSHHDIDINHGDKIGLADKLKDIYDNVPMMIPPGMTVQADLLHSGAKDTRQEMIDGVQHTTFKSNLLRYGVPSDSEEAQNILNSKVGLAIHTIYDENGKPRPVSDEDLAKIRPHPSVHLMNVKPMNPPVITPEQAQAVQQHLQNAQNLHAAMMQADPKTGLNAYQVVEPHGLNMETYVNHTIRHGEPQSIGGFMQWNLDRAEREASKMKSPAGQLKKRLQGQQIIADIKKNKAHFQNAMQLQQELEGATSHLSDTMMSTHGYRSFIGDQETGPEGHVYNYKGKSVKIVRRRPSEAGGVAFSQANLQKGGVGK